MKPLKKTLLSAAMGLMLAPMASHAVNGVVYSISVKGTVMNTTSPIFTKSGSMILFNTITTTEIRNGKNPVDMIMGTGNVWSTFPSPGTLNFTTNSALATLFGNYSSISPLVRSRLDLAYVTSSTGCVTIQPELSSLSSLRLNNPNLYIANDSLAASLYAVQSGDIFMCTKNNGFTWDGTISLKGNSYYQSYMPPTEYSATFTAKFVGNMNFNI